MTLHLLPGRLRTACGFPVGASGAAADLAGDALSHRSSLDDNSLSKSTVSQEKASSIFHIWGMHTEFVSNHAGV